MVAATLLALGSAFLHAGWNLVVKTSEERYLTAWGQMLIGGVVAAPVLVFTGIPTGVALAYLGVSTIVHVVYVSALVQAYHHGDFSFAYPIARGGGALVAALGGVAFLGDRLPIPAWLAIAVIVAGLASMVSRHITAVAFGWASFTGLTIGTYTTLDAAGSRASDSGVGYGVALIFSLGIAMTVVGLVRGLGPAFVTHVRVEWVRLAFAGLAGVAAYSMVLTAVRFAPVGYVAALRESSVVLAALGGWLVLKEQLGRARLVSACVVVVGLVLLILLR